MEPLVLKVPAPTVGLASCSPIAMWVRSSVYSSAGLGQAKSGSLYTRAGEGYERAGEGYEIISTVSGKPGQQSLLLPFTHTFMHAFN